VCFVAGDAVINTWKQPCVGRTIPVIKMEDVVTARSVGVVDQRIVEQISVQYAQNVGSQRPVRKDFQ
jgi:hypothetical protein